MFTDLKPYPEYQATVVDRFAGIPANWEHKRLRYLFREVDVRSSAGTERPLSMSQTLGLVPAEDVRRSLSASSHVGGKLCLPGDMVLNRLKAHLGVFAVSQQPGVVSPDYTVFRTIAATDPTYFERLLRSEVLRTELRRRTKGIVEGFWRLYTDDFYDIVVPVPPADEQAAIVKYLGHANTRIDRAIAAKRKLIELLEEQKQAIINQAVTRGLDPTVPLKDSGVPWISKVPVNWRTSRFKLNVGFQEGPGIMAADFRDSGVPLLRIASMAGAEVSLEGCNYLDPVKVKSRWAHFRVEKEDYLLSASGTVGAVKPVGREAVGAIPYTGIIRLWPKSSNLDMEFLRLFMAAKPFVAQIDSAKSGVGIEHFGPTHLNRMWILMPPLEEQRAIVSKMSASTAETDWASAHASREIELLQEFKARLTADVVTGQVDIRATALRLPELDLSDLVRHVEQDEDGLEAEIAERLEQVDA
jgi:type I restriction enzyme, S subunit